MLFVKTKNEGCSSGIRLAAAYAFDVFREKNLSSRELTFRPPPMELNRFLAFVTILLEKIRAIVFFRKLKEFLRRRRILFSDQWLTRRFARRRFAIFPRRARRLRREVSRTRRRNLRRERRLTGCVNPRIALTRLRTVVQGIVTFSPYGKTRGSLSFLFLPRRDPIALRCRSVHLLLDFVRLRTLRRLYLPRLAAKRRRRFCFLCCFL